MQAPILVLGHGKWHIDLNISPTNYSSNFDPATKEIRLEQKVTCLRANSEWAFNTSNTGSRTYPSYMYMRTVSFCAKKNSGIYSYIHSQPDLYGQLYFMFLRHLCFHGHSSQPRQCVIVCVSVPYEIHHVHTMPKCKVSQRRCTCKRTLLIAIAYNILDSVRVSLL